MPNLTLSQKNLMRRYFVWCYKTTKEDLDRIDRYFTQVMADKHMLGRLRKAKDYRAKDADPDYVERVNSFEDYFYKKEAKALEQKYSDPQSKKLTVEYQYLQNRLTALEETVVHYLGKTELDKIIRLYEDEMTTRILQAREHT